MVRRLVRSRLFWVAGAEIYRAVSIWRERFSVNFATAPLR